MEVLYAAPAGDASPFLQGTLEQEEGERCLVQPSSGGSSIWLPRASVFRKSPPAGAPEPKVTLVASVPVAHPCARGRCSAAAGPTGLADNAQLFYLDEANLLDNLSIRYGADAIYTYTGTVLLAVNPYKKIEGLYEEDQMDAYRGRTFGVLPPHVFAIASSYPSIDGCSKPASRCLMASDRSSGGSGILFCPVVRRDERVVGSWRVTAPSGAAWKTSIVTVHAWTEQYRQAGRQAVAPDIQLRYDTHA